MMNLPQPRYRDLPTTASKYRCSWEYFNSLPSNHGKKDQLGTLNFLAANRRALAVKEEVKNGRAIPLDLPIGYFDADISAFGGRSRHSHSLTQAVPFSFDDHLDFNTQSSSQWDGFRHFAIRKTGDFYNGCKAAEFASGDKLGINAWAAAGGIFGRGVLIDFHSWAASHGETVNVNGGRRITLADVKAILKHQNTTVRPGDILIFRTGWLAWYQTTPATKRHEELCVRHAPGSHHFIGLDQDPDFVEWLWDNQIAAVAGDQPAFEATPPPDGGFGWLHEHLLAALGCPMGELWDTEGVAAECEAQGRYTFCLSSSPLFVLGGVASPANAFAMF